jgi:hypothetical protein
MKYRLLTAIFVLTAMTSFGQINMADSTVQVITYWETGEKQDYVISVEKINLKDADTTSREMTTYEVEVTVLNSDKDFYTIQWLYKNIQTDNPNPAFQKLMKITNGMKVIFKTDEVGIFLEVVNHKEIKDYTQKAILSLKNDFREIPEMEKVLNQAEATFSTKEAIETVCIKDIHQFYTFHGAKYTLGEILEGKTKAPNVYGSEPFDADFTVYLDEINEPDDTYVMRAAQEIDKEQLTNATLDYLITMAKNMGVDPPKPGDLGAFQNEILTASNIHGTGWVLYSIQTTTVTSGNVSNIEERIIEMR